MLVRQLILLFVSMLFLLQSNAQPQLISINEPDTNPTLNGLFELDIQLTTSVTNPYDFNSVRLFGIFSSPDGTTYEQDGFLYQHFESENGLLVPSGDTYWKIRFTPRQTGNWTFRVKVVDADGFDISETISFQCLAADNPGFVSFDWDSRYLSDDQGKTIFLVGENIAWSEYQSGNDRMHLFMSGLAESGANFAKLMMVPWSYSIEWGVDGLMNYANRQDRAFLLDSVFRMAHHHGLYLQLAFSIHNELRDGYAGEDWQSNPYNQINGGPCAEPRDFFSNPTAKEIFINRMRYISARWGYEPLLFGWELLSESDNFPNYSQFADDVASWAGQMAGLMKEIDPNNHPVSVGFALTTSNPDVWNHPDIGFTQLHYYTERADIEGEIFRMTGVYNDAYNKAVLVGEYGIGHIMDSIIAKDPDGWALHNGLWTSALSGSFGSVVPWYWDAYIHELDLYYRFTGISSFMRNETLNNDVFTPKHLTTITDDRRDFVVAPDFDELTKKAPSGNFTLPSTGLLLPAEDSMGTLLFGPLSVFAGLRNPPVLNGDWTQNSVMIIETGSQVSGGVLQVKIDGVVVFEQSVVAGGIYHIEVPEGEHNIMVDNIGTTFLSIIELEAIVFSDYLPKIRAFGLLSNTRALVWVHNTTNNWHWYRQQSEPPEAVSGGLILPFYSGLFQIDKWSTLSGMMEESNQLMANENGLFIPVEALSTDMALKVSFITEVVETTMPAEHRMSVFPNPSTGRVTFAIETSAGEMLRLEISDLFGRIIHEQHKSWSGAGLRQLLWEPDRKGKGAQVYVYRLTAGTRHFTGKLIVE